jgi:hypothetical protein
LSGGSARKICFTALISRFFPLTLVEVCDRLMVHMAEILVEVRPTAEAGDLTGQPARSFYEPG